MARLVVQGYINAAGLGLPELMAAHEHIITEADGLTGFSIYPVGETDRAEVYADMSEVVEQYGGRVGWHLCSHDDPEPTPCIPLEVTAR